MPHLGVLFCDGWFQAQSAGGDFGVLGQIARWDGQATRLLVALSPSPSTRYPEQRRRLYGTRPLRQ